MNYRHIALAGAFVLTAALPHAAGAQSPRAVIELFTSQGCSSCPAADKLLADLSRDPTLITMSLAVDYWDYLGWKDTLALHGHSNREHAYADARGDREVYTPQVVVNGLAQALGSDKAAIESAIAKTRAGATPLTVPVKLTVGSGTVSVAIPAVKDQKGSAEVWLCPITGKASVVIDRGENHGRTLTYTNVVRRWIKLGVWNGAAATFTVPVANLAGADVPPDDIDRVAVVVQSGVATKPGLMLGAAMANLRDQASN